MGCCCSRPGVVLGTANNAATFVATAPAAAVHFVPTELPDSCLDPLPLLELSDDILLLVMQCCVAIDPFSLFSVSRAPSRLHKAAKAAMRSIKAVLSPQQQVDGVMRYLGEHCTHVISIELRGDEDRPWAVEIRQLPPNLRLTSLRLQGAAVQLRPGMAFRACWALLRRLPA